MKRTFWWLRLAVCLLVLASVSQNTMGQQADRPGRGELKFTNVRYSPTRDGLVGAVVRLVREGSALSGRLTLYEGNNGRTYQLKGRMSGSEVHFMVSAGERTIEFDGQVQEGTLSGTLTTTLPNGSRSETEFKARRIYQ